MVKMEKNDSCVGKGVGKVLVVVWIDIVFLEDNLLVFIWNFKFCMYF